MTRQQTSASFAACQRGHYLRLISMLCYPDCISRISRHPTKIDKFARAAISKRTQKIFGSYGQVGSLTPRETNPVSIHRPLSLFSRASQFATGEGRMKGWSADELAELRAAFSSLGVNPEAIDEQIRVLDNIAKSWVDQSFGFSSIKLTLSQRANYSFDGVEVCDKSMKLRTIQRKERGRRERLPGISDSKGPSEP